MQSAIAYALWILESIAIGNVKFSQGMQIIAASIFFFFLVFLSIS